MPSLSVKPTLPILWSPFSDGIVACLGFAGKAFACRSETYRKVVVHFEFEQISGVLWG